MKILFKEDDFSVKSYEIKVGESGLEFMGEREEFSIPYSAVKDFYITEDAKGRVYFTAIFNNKLYEGKIPDKKGIVPFTSILKAKIGGVIRANIQKN